jgi:hypothetical protein
MGDGFTSAQIQKGVTGVATTATVVGGTAAVLSATGATVTITTGSTVVALAGGGTAVMTTTFTAGAANVWNPVGWVCLIIAAVAALVVLGTIIYENWDAICEFFSWIGSWFAQKATIVYEWVMDTAVPWITDAFSTSLNWVTDTAFPAVTSTISQAWEAVASIPIPTVQRRYKRGMKNLTASLATALAAERLLPKDDAVYKITMLLAGDYDQLIFGKPTTTYTYVPGVNSDVYKYGTTKNGIKGRYPAGSYVFRNIVLLERMKDDFVKESLNFYEARIVEKSYIYGHFMQWLYYPPGNSKLG